MSRRKKGGIKTAIIVDPFGHGFGEVTPEMEIGEHVKDYNELLRPGFLDWVRVDSARDIPLGTKLVLFDYGGMMSGYGNGDLLDSQARELIKFASDNPSSLVIVVSDFCYRGMIRYELEEQGLNLHNVVSRENHSHDPIPLWFRGLAAGAHHPIAGLMPIGGTLPDAQWFSPSKAFVRYIKKAFLRENIYDVGAGMGHTVKALTDAGLKWVKGIDANRREGAVAKVEIADGTTFDYSYQPVILICRPCHGPTCEAFIHRAVACRARAILYVGLPKNAEGDLGQFADLFTVTLTKAGTDGESIYEWRPEWNRDVVEV